MVGILDTSIDNLRKNKPLPMAVLESSSYDTLELIRKEDLLVSEFMRTLLDVVTTSTDDDFPLDEDQMNIAVLGWLESSKGNLLEGLK
jgi:hypothetical protein